MRLLRQGAFRDVRELQSRLPGRALFGPQDPLQEESPIYKKKNELVATKKKLAEQEQALGVDHNRTLFAVDAVGFLLREARQLTRTYCRRAFEGYELGGDHPNIRGLQEREGGK